MTNLSMPKISCIIHPLGEKVNRVVGPCCSIDRQRLGPRPGNVAVYINFHLMDDISLLSIVGHILDAVLHPFIKDQSHAV